MLGLLVVLLPMTKPYKDIEITDKYIVREFSENIDPIELLWHRDDENRTVEIIGETDWKLQLDNQLPTSINQPIFIPKHEWHRVIKGTGTLKLKRVFNESPVFSYTLLIFLIFTSLHVTSSYGLLKRNS